MKCFMQKAGLGVGLVASSLLLSSCHDNLQSARDQVKKETLDLIQKDLSADEYVKILEDEKKHINSCWAVPANYSVIQYWDSLKTDALCKKAYLEGAQMVRDSIANSQKAD